MSEPGTGVFRINPLPAWQRDAITKALQLLRDRFGDPPSDPHARSVHDALLEVLDPELRTVRLQKDMSHGAHGGAFNERTERRVKERRGNDRRKVDIGPPPGILERRKGERRKGDRRNRT
jgi:hypothetical protein